MAQSIQRDRFRVIVIDDEEVVRNGLAKSPCFPSAGFHVVGTAADGQEALTLLRQTNPDLIVTDINMPVMDGLTFLSVLRDAGDETAVLILSCYDDFQFAQRAIKLQVVSYLLKPFTDSELAAALKDTKRLLLERRRERHGQETEQFILQSKEIVLLDLLRQAIIRGGREEIIYNIHHFKLMPRFPFYGMVYMSGVLPDAQNLLREKLSKCGSLCFLMETADCGVLILVCPRGTSVSHFSGWLQEMCGEWRSLLALPLENATISEVFPSLEQAHEEFLRILAKHRLEGHDAGNSANSGRGDRRKEIQKAIALIEKHLCEESLCLNMVAESIYISPFYFSRLFTQEMGTSFVRYVNTRRVEKACVMLRENKLRIYEISKLTGFQSETYFHQVFKSVKGITPKGYQRKTLSNRAEV